MRNRAQAVVFSDQANNLFQASQYNQAINQYQMAVSNDYLLIDARVGLALAQIELGNFRGTLDEFTVADMSWGSLYLKEHDVEITRLAKLLIGLSIETDQESLEKKLQNNFTYFRSLGITAVEKKIEYYQAKEDHEKVIAGYQALAKFYEENKASSTNINIYQTNLVTSLRKYADATIDRLLSDEKFKTTKKDKEYLFEQLKSLSPDIKIYLLRQALDPETQLGKVFWRPRGVGSMVTQPSLSSGTLQKIQAEISAFENANGYGHRSLYSMSIDEKIKIEPLNAGCYIHRANSTLKMLPKANDGIYDQEQINLILEDLNRSIIAEPNKHHGYYNRAYIYTLMEDNLSALNDINKAIALNPEGKANYELKINVLSSLYRFDEAALIKQVMTIGFAKELETAKDQKRFVFDQIKMHSDKKKLALLQQAMDRETILGAIIWTGLDPVADLNKGIIKEIKEEIAKLNPSAPAHEENTNTNSKKTGVVSFLFTNKKASAAATSPSVNIDDEVKGIAQMELMEGSESDEDSNNNNKPKKKSSWNFLGKTENKPKTPVLKVLAPSMQFTRGNDSDL